MEGAGGHWAGEGGKILILRSGKELLAEGKKIEIPCKQPGAS